MSQITCGGFRMAHYREILEAALANGYRFATFADHETEDVPKLILMRHDIDLSIDNCVAFAHIEHERGVRATYFVRLHARQYNPFEYHTYRKLREIEGLGHELALHYEPGFAAAVAEDEAQMVRREKTMLEALLDHPVISASAHLPGKSGMTVNEANLDSFSLRYEAYTPRFMKGFKYLSDSNGRWREGCVCGHLGEYDRLHVLIHGFWWYDKSPVENY